MKTSIFDMNFVLPPLVEMTHVLPSNENISALPPLCTAAANTCTAGWP